MFHQLQILLADKNELRFLWHFSKNSPIDTQRMNIHLFGKIDSPCSSNWAFRKTALDNQQQFNENVINAGLARF